MNMAGWIVQGDWSEAVIWSWRVFLLVPDLIS